MIGGKLVDAKGHYSQFVDKNSGEFHEWFAESATGGKAIIDEANRQIKAANGVPIQWYFAEKESMMAFKTLFTEKKITGIEFIHKPMI